MERVPIGLKKTIWLEVVQRYREFPPGGLVWKFQLVRVVKSERIG